MGRQRSQLMLHFIPLSKSPSSRNELYLVEFLAERGDHPPTPPILTYHVLVHAQVPNKQTDIASYWWRLLVSFYSLTVSPITENIVYLYHKTFKSKNKNKNQTGAHLEVSPQLSFMVLKGTLHAIGGGKLNHQYSPLTNPAPPPLSAYKR